MTTSARVLLRDFNLANELYIGALVSCFVPDSEGSPSTSYVTLYADITGTATLSNPQTLDGQGKLLQPTYHDQSMICVVSTPSVPDHQTGIINPVVFSVASGVTSERPSDLGSNDVGYRFYDTTLSQPVYWSGSVWKNSLGVSV